MKSLDDIACMATELTHIKFAHDMCGDIVTSLSDLYSGAVYPDSRYVTGIKRDLTHANCPTDPFQAGLSDFERGWASHILYDGEAKPRYLALSPYGSQEARQGDDQWCFITAAKILEDHSLAKSAPEFQNCFAQMVPPTEPPNGEPPAELQKYHQILAELYSSHPDLEGYRHLVRAFGAGEELEQKIFREIYSICDNPRLHADLLRIYPEILANIKQ